MAIQDQGNNPRTSYEGNQSWINFSAPIELKFIPEGRFFTYPGTNTTVVASSDGPECVEFSKVPGSACQVHKSNIPVYSSEEEASLTVKEALDQFSSGVRPAFLDLLVSKLHFKVIKNADGSIAYIPEMTASDGGDNLKIVINPQTAAMQFERRGPNDLYKNIPEGVSYYIGGRGELVSIDPQYLEQRVLGGTGTNHDLLIRFALVSSAEAGTLNFQFKDKKVVPVFDDKKLVGAAQHRVAYSLGFQGEEEKFSEQTLRVLKESKLAEKITGLSCASVIFHLTDNIIGVVFTYQAASLYTTEVKEFLKKATLNFASDGRLASLNFASSNSNDNRELTVDFNGNLLRSSGFKSPEDIFSVTKGLGVDTPWVKYKERRLVTVEGSRESYYQAYYGQTSEAKTVAEQALLLLSQTKWGNRGLDQFTAEVQAVRLNEEIVDIPVLKAPNEKLARVFVGVEGAPTGVIFESSTGFSAATRVGKTIVMNMLGEIISGSTPKEIASNNKTAQTFTKQAYSYVKNFEPLKAIHLFRKKGMVILIF